MHWMSEAEVGSRRAWRWRPFDSLLDCAVMTLGTVLRLRPQGGTRQGHAGVAAGASGKEGTVLPMVEPVLGLGLPALEHEWNDQEYHEQAAGHDHVPARRRARCARGSGTWSALLPNRRVTRAFSRVWFQSNPLASGRRRSSR